LKTAEIRNRTAPLGRIVAGENAGGRIQFLRALQPRMPIGARKFEAQSLVAGLNPGAAAFENEA
jgi:hypothetical protein